MVLLVSSCVVLDERSEDPTIFVNDIPQGGPVIKVVDETLGTSYEEILKWLKKDSHKTKFRKSLAWLQMETDTIIHEVDGLTAKQLIDYTNSLKKKKYQN